MEKLLYALSNNALVSINDVEKGLNCNCLCPACKQPLIAKKGNHRVHHFAHANGCSCEHGYETSLHLLAKEILSISKTFVLPKICFGDYNNFCISEPRIININEVHIEKTINDFKPDIIINTNYGEISLEIYVTHKVDDKKIEKLAKAGCESIEIDLSKINKLITYDDLKNILINDSELKKWIYNKQIEILKKELILDKADLCHCINQHKNNPSYTYCITECEHYLEEEKKHNQKFYCKNAKAIKTNGQKLEDEFCHECGCLMQLDYGKYGAFYKCTGCNNTKNAPNFDIFCPKCKNKLVLRKSKYKKFLGCSNFPDCDYTESFYNFTKKNDTKQPYSK